LSRTIIFEGRGLDRQQTAQKGRLDEREMADFEGALFPSGREKKIARPLGPGDGPYESRL